jgi:hypothetical protein
VSLLHHAPCQRSMRRVLSGELASWVDDTGSTRQVKPSVVSELCQLPLETGVELIEGARLEMDSGRAMRADNAAGYCRRLG